MSDRSDYLLLEAHNLPSLARGPFADFLIAIAARLERGAQTYGDASFDRPLPELIEELRQECLDLAGWAFPVFVRLAALEELARRIEESKPKTDTDNPNPTA